MGAKTAGWHWHGLGYARYTALLALVLTTGTAATIITTPCAHAAAWDPTHVELGADGQTCEQNWNFWANTAIGTDVDCSGAVLPPPLRPRIS